MYSLSAVDKRHNLLCRRIRLQQMITKINRSTRRRAQPLQFACPTRICHCPDLTGNFLTWKNFSCAPGASLQYLHKTFEHKLRSTRGARHEFRCIFRCVLRFWSVLSNVQCCANQGSVLLCLLFIQTVRTVTQNLYPLFSNQVLEKTFHFVCSSCFFPLKPKPSATASVCFGSCVQEKPSAFHATFLCRNSTAVRNPGPIRSQIFT